MYLEPGDHLWIDAWIPTRRPVVGARRLRGGRVGRRLVGAGLLSASDGGPAGAAFTVHAGRSEAGRARRARVLRRTGTGRGLRAATARWWACPSGAAARARSSRPARTRPGTPRRCSSSLISPSENGPSSPPSWNGVAVGLRAIVHAGDGCGGGPRAAGGSSATSAWGRARPDSAVRSTGAPSSVPGPALSTPSFVCCCGRSSRVRALPSLSPAVPAQWWLPPRSSPSPAAPRRSRGRAGGGLWVAVVPSSCLVEGKGVKWREME